MNRKISKCIFCGLATSFVLQSTPVCHKCFEEKHCHLPEKNYETGFSSSIYSVSGVDVSASPSPPPPASPITTLED